MSFWKPGTAFPGAEMEGDRDIQAEGGLKYVFNPNQNSTLDIQRQNLPIFKQSNKKKKKIKNHKGSTLLYAVENYQVVVVVAETGSGKSTRKNFFFFLFIF